MIQSLPYCRRPRATINLSRDHDTELCGQNGGQLHHFNELRSNQTNISDILHQWRSSVERVEEYSLFSRDPLKTDGSLCQCLQPTSFGKNCEYQLPAGETLEETLEWQLIMRIENPQKVHVYGDVICYETLGCDSGALCLDWREICDGIQHCLEGKDEENCDLLEMNVCDDNEYRCMNGMCIPEEYFLDGELDCLDWSDEMPFKKSEDCFGESVSTECDDHLCPPAYWSCGEGQCIPSRLAFQRSSFEPTCSSGRDQYFLCETRIVMRQWTMPNGRCYQNGEYEEISTGNRSVEQQCEYLLKCNLSQNAEIGCVEKLENVCQSSPIPYPRQAVIAPYIFFLYNRDRDWQSKQPDFIRINGTVRCQHSLINMSKMVPFVANLGRRQTLEDYICRPSRSNLSSSEIETISQRCHRANESIDVCNEWNPCFSITRMNDGWPNCLNRTDELGEGEMEIEQSCARVRRHRFRCAAEQPTCLAVWTMGSGKEECRNRFDELWFGTGRKVSLLYCNGQRNDECPLLHQYIEHSWTVENQSTDSGARHISFRSHCDTFENLATGEDENLSECRQWWICSESQRRCGTGQCVEQSWFDDGEWDCPDASDEYQWMRVATETTLRRASAHNFTSQSYFVPSTCNQSDPFLCLSSQSTQQGFSCLNLSQLGDGHIDCAGAIDERNTLRACSDSSVLGNRFLCPSTNTCIPYFLHCNEGHRCPNPSDDQHWCSRQPQALSSSCDPNDFACFDGRCFKGGRCNRLRDCPFAEDEYLCDYQSSFSGAVVPSREEKRFTKGREVPTLLLSQYPFEANVTKTNTTSLPSTNLSSNLSSASLSPYWCNRGLGILLTKNASIVCLCPPHYSGEKCQYHTDRLSVLVTLNLSQSSYFLKGNHPKIVFKLLVLLLFNDEILLNNHFQFLPASQINLTLHQQQNNLISHFLYPHSLSSFRRERFFNRSSLLHHRPFSIRLELYRMEHSDHPPSLMGIWKYPLHFDHLPVVRLAKVLHYTDSSTALNPCSSQPCQPNEQCHQLMSHRSQHICLCKTNWTGRNCSVEDSQCLRGYCSPGSLCQANWELLPFCLCPVNRFGRRCSLENDACNSSPCLNNGSCFPHSKPGQVLCLCPQGYVGAFCRERRMSIDLSLSTDLPHRAAVIQFFEIDLSSLNLILLHQHVSRTAPSQIEYLHYDDLPVTGLVLAKFYLSDDEPSTASDLHLLSVYLNATSVHAATNISSSNRCEQLRSFSHVALSPIRYHQICIQNRTRLCFRDDVYLCICAENHTRVECFLYDDHLDQCSHCLNGGRCLQSDRRRSSDYLCLCPSCHFGRHCQSSTGSFSFTLDQLFSIDLQESRRETVLPLLIFFSLFTFLLAVPNNLFSFVTLRRRRCLRQGVGHYLLWMSVVNQINLAFLVIRLIHLLVQISDTSPSSISDDVLCKSLNYLLSSSTRLVYWLTSLISIERLYTTVSLRGHWLKQPHIARRLILFIFSVVFVSDLYELFFYKSFSSSIDGQGSICLLQISATDRSRWLTFHLLFLILHSLLPFLINLFSTITICLIVVKKKINTTQINLSQYFTERSRSVHVAMRVSRLDGRVDQSVGMKMRGRLRLIADVLTENKEFVLGPAITLVPQLFSLPLFISSFLLDCRNLDDSWLRHFLIISYWISFTPQWTSFLLYIVPSSLYSSEWRKADLHRWIDNLLHRRSSVPVTAATFSALSSIRFVIKDTH